MKKALSLLLAALLCASSLFCFSGCDLNDLLDSKTAADDTPAETTAAPEKEPEKEPEVDYLTLADLKELKTKKDLADLLVLEKEGQLNQMLAYLRNYNAVLPTTEEKPEPVTTWHVDEDQHNYLTVAEMKTLVSGQVVTTENWKDFFEVGSITVECWGFEAEEPTYEQEPAILLKSEYHSTFQNSLLELCHESGESISFKNGYWSVNLEYDEEQVVFYAYFGTPFGTQYEFNLEDFTCTFADAIVYTYDVSPELLYVDFFDESIGDEGDWVTLPYVGNEEDFELDDTYVILQTGEGANLSWAQVGYNSIGYYLYELG